MQPTRKLYEKWNKNDYLQCENVRVENKELGLGELNNQRGYNKAGGTSVTATDCTYRVSVYGCQNVGREL